MSCPSDPSSVARATVSPWKLQDAPPSADRNRRNALGPNAPDSSSAVPPRPNTWHMR